MQQLRIYQQKKKTNMHIVNYISKNYKMYVIFTDHKRQDRTRISNKCTKKIHIKHILLIKVIQQFIEKWQRPRYYIYGQ